MGSKSSKAGMAGKDSAPAAARAAGGARPTGGGTTSEFAADALAAARTAAGAGFHGKVYVADAYDAYLKTPAGKASGLSLEGFKERLVEANRGRHLTLSRLDLVEAVAKADRPKLARSQIYVDNRGKVHAKSEVGRSEVNFSLIRID